jgi:hypothetical protein
VKLTLASAALVGLLLLLVSPASAQVKTTVGPGGTPQFDPSIERRPYLKAGPDEVLTYGFLVQQAAADLPIDAGPDEVKASPLRKLLLDLRLMMDFNAFLYETEKFRLVRDRVDASYESIGLYKDLFDQAKLTGDSIDPAERRRRAEEMNASLEWLRDPLMRREMAGIMKAPEVAMVDLERADQPRIWKIADITPVGGKSSLATVALLAANALHNLGEAGLLVDDILDLEQEERFHDVRKALRSVLVLVDMFPTAARVIGDLRKPLAEVVSAYGDVNDASIAYHTAIADGRPTGELRADLVKSYRKAHRVAEGFVGDGHLQRYVNQLIPLHNFDVDPFN